MTAVSQWEREAIGERTKDALRHKKAQGQRVGSVPYGCSLADDGVHLQGEPKEHEIISRARTLAAIGISTRKIADDLNRSGYRTRKGTEWRFQYVASILASKPASQGAGQQTYFEAGK